MHGTWRPKVKLDVLVSRNKNKKNGREYVGENLQENAEILPPDARRHESISIEFKTPAIVIIGAGPVGIRCAQLILDTNYNQDVIVYGDESADPYDRVNLSAYIAGHVSRKSLANPVNAKIPNKFKQITDCRIVEINREKKYVVDQYQRRQSYSKLILATGSSVKPLMIDGVRSSSIRALRTIDDADYLLSIKDKIQHLVIVGGGLLGVEIAIAMKTARLNVTLLAPHGLLTKMISTEASEVLGDYLLSQGVSLKTNVAIDSCRKTKKGTSLFLADGETLACDEVVAAIGTQPNTALGESAHLKLEQGIVVNDHMQTSDPNIYAIGECAEHKNVLHGYVAPGYSQAQDAVDHMHKVNRPKQIALNKIELKVLKQSVTLVGETSLHNGECKKVVYVNKFSSEYRQVFIKKGRLVGYISIGDWAASRQLQQAIKNKQRIYFWQLKRFKEQGELWKESASITTNDLPDDYIVCLCNNVTRQKISHSMADGNRTVESIGAATFAGTTCGSCKFMINEMLDQPVEHLVMRHHKKVVGFSLVCLLLIVMYAVMPPVNAVLSIENGWTIANFWFDNFWKQVSGYGLLGFMLLAGAYIARRRIKKVNLGHLDDWRLLHIIIGVITMGILFLHTGMRFGENLNKALMIVFLIAAFMGSSVGILMATSGHWPEARLQKWRHVISRFHYTLLWTLPALLIFHIISVYYF